MELNLWWLVPNGLGPALDAVRAAGVKVAIVSNSEGMLDVLFDRLAIARHFDLVVDSGKVGIEKPDAGIWDIALAAHPTPADAVLHLGDTYATDIAGAKALGFRNALIDPLWALRRSADLGGVARARGRRSRARDRPKVQVPAWPASLTDSASPRLFRSGWGDGRTRQRRLQPSHALGASAPGTCP